MVSENRAVRAKSGKRYGKEGSGAGVVGGSDGGRWKWMCAVSMRSKPASVN